MNQQLAAVLKEVEEVKRTASVQNQAYQNFLKEKLIAE